MKKRILALLMAFTITSICVVGCGEESSAENVSDNNANSLLVVSSVAPKTTDINIMGEYVGTLEYNDQISVFPMLSGEITGMYFEEGDYVEEGELMFTLDDKAYQLQLQNANKTYQSAENGLTQQLGALEMQRNSAVNSLDTAKEGVRQIEDSKNYYEDQKKDLDTTKSDLQTDRADMKQDLLDMRDDKKEAEDDLEDASKELEKAAKAYYEREAAKAKQDAIIANMGEAEWRTAFPTEIRITDGEIKLLKEAYDAQMASVSGLAQQIAAYESADAQMSAAIKQMDSSMDQLDSSKEGLQFQQDNLDYSLAQANRGVILAQENLDYFDNFTAPMTQQAAEISLSQAKIGISSAQLQLDYTKVKAPASGKIIAKSNNSGDLAQAGYPVYMILPENTINASFNVPESVWRELQIGSPVTVERNGVTYNGKITEIATSINPQVGMFTIKAAISGNTDDLVTGTSVVVKAVTKSIPNALTIPVDCVYYEGGNTYTYTVSEDGIISKVYLETGLYDSENMEIKSGVTSDMNVVTTWSSDLHDGLKVTVDNE